MRIVLYQKVVRLNGTYTFDRIFTRNFGQEHEITYLYEAGDQPLIDEVCKFARPVQNVGQKIECDLCIYSSIAQGAHRVTARKYAQVVHTDLHEWNVVYKPVKVDFHIAVGQGVADSLKIHNGLDSIVIPNILDEPNVEPVLRLLTASRIAEKKGFERIVKLSKILATAGKRFVWEIYGSGAPGYVGNFRYSIANTPSVVLMGERRSIQSYMARSDYVVQLSDSEGFCYSIYEALQVGTPVIVTRWPGVESVVKDGVNGHILDMDLGNLDIEKLYNQIPACGKLEVENSLLLWRELFSKV